MIDWPIYRQTDRKNDRLADLQTVRQIDLYTEGERVRETERETDREGRGVLL